MSAHPAVSQDGPAAARGGYADQVDPETRVEDLIVEGRRLVEETTAFVRAVALPIGDRGLSRWHTPICVGVANMQADAARQMADRISDWAYSFGLPVADPACTPTILVVATDDGDRTAVELVASRPREFRTGSAFSDRGASALRRFQNSGRPIRWWHISAVVNPETGRMAGRRPRHEPIDLAQSHMKKPSDFGSRSMTIVPSRIRRPDRDELQQVIVVFDTKALARADFGQLTDYIALISLINVDPDGDARGHDTILNLFDESMPQAETLTAWDRAQLQGIYGSEQDQMGSRGNIASVAALMARDMASPTS